MASSCTRFREDVIANPYLFRYWQLAKNTFYPKKKRFATIHIVDKLVADRIKEALYNPNIASICLNDTSLCSEDDFAFVDSNMKKWLEQKFPEKSSFEI